MELPPPPGTRARFARPSVWSRFKQSLRTSSCTAETTNNGSADGSTRNGDCNRLQTSDTREGDHREHCEEEGELVEKIICDNDSAPENWKSIPKSPSNAHTATNTGHHPTNKSVASSHHSDAEATPLHQIYNFIRWRIVPNLVHFCSPRYSDPHEEDAFQREVNHHPTTGFSIADFGLVELARQQDDGDIRWSVSDACLAARVRSSSTLEPLERSANLRPRSSLDDSAHSSRLVLLFALVLAHCTTLASFRASRR